MYNFPYFALEPQRAMTPVVNNSMAMKEPSSDLLQNNLLLRKQLIYIHPLPFLQIY